jgi:hypothetical protein
VLRPDTGQAFINTETNWRWLKEDASKAARWLGYVPFYQIRDERNEPAELYGTDGAIIEPRGMRRLAASPGDMAAEVPALSEMLPTLSLKGGTSPRQPFRIALIGEKKQPWRSPATNRSRSRRGTTAVLRRLLGNPCRRDG